MSIYKDEAKGTWYCKFRYTDWQGNKKETTKRGFKTKREAKQYETDFKASSQSKPEMTIKQLYEIYTDHEDHTVKESTAQNVRSILKNHVLPYLADKKLSDVTPNIIREWQNAIKDSEKLNSTSIKSANGTFSAMLNFAVKYYNLSSNPFSITGKTGKKKKREMFWSIEEFNKVMERAVIKPRELKYAIMLKILFFSGMRYGELAALTFDDIDFKTNTITINKGYMQSVERMSTPKTDNSYRTIAMPAELMFDLRKYRNKLYTIPEHPFLCRSEFLRVRMRRWSKEAGVDYIHIHCLRHSHASYLLHKGFPLPAVAARLGDTVETLLSVYAHATKSDEQDMLAQISKDVGQSVVKT